MPLSSASPNVEVPQVAFIKRPHTEFVDANAAVGATCQAPVDANPLDSENFPAGKTPSMSASTTDCQPQLSIVAATQTRSSPLGSGPDTPTEPDFSTPTGGSLSPDATLSGLISTHPAQPQAATKLPVRAPKHKRKAMTEGLEKEREEKKRRQEDAAAEKARIAAEKEAIRTAKAAEKAKADAEREFRRLKKQEEELAAKAKTEKQTEMQQNLMANFLRTTPAMLSKQSNYSSTTAKASTTSTSGSNQETQPAKSAYELNFKPFFVKPGVTMAKSPFKIDDEKKGIKSAILDECIRGGRGEFSLGSPFNAAKVFDCELPQRRGFIPPSIRELMQDIHRAQTTSDTPSSGRESQTDISFINAQGLLNTVPMKYLCFFEDVRPAYFGTVTTPMNSYELRSLSRRPTERLLALKKLKTFNYDSDSEAEWAEDDGEDLDDAEEEEEELDGDEEMDDFLDDSEAVTTVTRLGFEPDSLPISSGLCFEDQKRLGPSLTMCNYRLELLTDTLEHHSMIDPFSVEYWLTPVKNSTPAISVASSTQGIAASTPIPRDAAASHCTAVMLDGKEGVPLDILEDFKRTLISDECKDFSKATVVELLAKKFSNCTKLQVKTTLERIAHRVHRDEKKKSAKQWTLLPNISLKEA